MSTATITCKLESLIHLIEELPSSNASALVHKYKQPTKRAKLYEPKLHDIVPAIEEGLQSNFKQVSVEVVECPDLREWADLSSEGICGNTRLIDAGGVPFMFDPDLQSTVSYDLNKLVQDCDAQHGLVIGAGAANPKCIGKNGELIPNLAVPNGTNNTRFVKMISSENGGNDDPVCRLYNESSCGCLCNLFVSDGACGEDVIHITAKGRTGQLNFTACVRESLQKVAGVGGNQQIGMGGVIKIKSGKIRGHVMPDFLQEQVDCMNPQDNAVDEWLYFYENGPNLVMMTTMITGDPTQANSMHLRVEHTHFYTLNEGVNEGGHYHYDTTPDEIEYEAYLNTAQYIYRVEDAFQYNLDKHGQAEHAFDAALIQ
eukprot:158430_1